jgi:hypothetical protein
VLNKKVVKMKKFLFIMILVASAMMLDSAKVYGQSNESCELIFYRPVQSMMSGGAGVEIKVFINDHEIVSLPNGTVLNYTVFSQGALKIKFVAVQMGTVVGSPKVINLDSKHGESTAFECSYKFPSGAIAEIANAKKHEKLKKMKWEDTMTGKENMEKPLIENN